jgi:methylmalonyl-CoA mutase
MSTFLFEDFDPISPAAWKQKIQLDLKGADYNQTLLWKTNEGIVVKPFYTEEDRNNANIALPKKGFNICQTVFVDDVSIANSLAIDALQRGANTIQFIANKKFDFAALLAGISTNSVLYFQLNFLDVNFVNELDRNCDPFERYYQFDVLGNLAKTGNWHEDFKADIGSTKSMMGTVQNCISVDASIYQNGGANMIQQLAYALAQTNEYIELFGTDVIKQIHYQFAVGSNYFFEIAKLRAFRILHASLLNEYGVGDLAPNIFTQPSLRNKTIYDYNVNMLRTTSECMSAVLGGSDTVCNVSYDTIYHKSNEFGERISRNQLLILQKEAYLHEAQNFADGSYYIENITKQLAEKALVIFKQIEKGGGFLKQLKTGTIQKKIKESAQKEQEQFNEEKIVLLGSNKLPNEKDRMKESLELYPFLKKKISRTLSPPIPQRRLSESYEKQRLEME